MVFRINTNGNDLTEEYATEEWVTTNFLSAGRVFCWGGKEGAYEFARLPVLGDGTIVAKSSPVQTLAGGTDWVRIVGGESHAFGIKTNGTTWAWGYNIYGQLGDGTSVSKSSPLQVLAGATWVALAAGVAHSAGIKADGTLWAWGRNNYGQLGDGTTDDKSNPVQVGTSNDWASVDCGYHTTAAIKKDGSLWTWGWNNKGQLGNGEGVWINSSPVQVGAENTWASISCGGNQMGGIKTDGTLWLWGGMAVNPYASASLLGRLDIAASTSPVQTGVGGNTWAKISCGNFCNGAIKTDGTLWMWGENDGTGPDGLLGDGTLVTRSTPVQIGLGTDWKDISTGSFATFGLKNDGTLWAWGGAYHVGELGDGTAVGKSSPVLVLGGNKWRKVQAVGAGGIAIASPT